jgi:hypothetical protein
MLLPEARAGLRRPQLAGTPSARTPSESESSQDPCESSNSCSSFQPGTGTGAPRKDMLPTSLLLATAPAPAASTVQQQEEEQQEQQQKHHQQEEGGQDPSTPVQAEAQVSDAAFEAQLQTLTVELVGANSPKGSALAAPHVQFVGLKLLLLKSRRGKK